MTRMSTRTVLTCAAVCLFAIACDDGPARDALSGGPAQAHEALERTEPAAVVATAAARQVSADAGDVGTHELGRAVYARERCEVCHSIAGQGNARYPLDNVGRRLSADEIRKWVIAPREMNPMVRKPKFELSESDLAALVQFLIALKDEHALNSATGAR